MLISLFRNEMTICNEQHLCGAIYFLTKRLNLYNYCKAQKEAKFKLVQLSKKGLKKGNDCSSVIKKKKNL